MRLTIDLDGLIEAISLTHELEEKGIVSTKKKEYCRILLLDLA